MAANIDILLQKIGNDLAQISKEASKIYEEQFNQLTADCLTKSFNQCEGTDQRESIENYPRPQQCLLPGITFSKSSGVRFPFNANKISQNLKTNEKLFVCASTQLDKIMKKVKQTYSNKIERVYIGTYFGFFRSYPAQIQENTNGICNKSYNPSLRPWYLGATTGPKNLIIMIDLSMNPNMLDRVKEAAILAIETLGVNDFLGVVIIKNSAKILIGQELIRATDQVKSSFQYVINSITVQSLLNLTQGDPNYVGAFQKVSELLGNAITDDYGTQCSNSNNVILLFSANPPTQQTKIFDLNGTQLQKYNISLISYGLGQKFKDSNSSQFLLLQQKSCENKGAFFQIISQDPKDKTLKQNIYHYIKQIETQVNIDKPVISQPYYDANTNKRMITVATPLYYYTEGGRYILGAAGIDVLMTVLEDSTISEKQVVKQLMSCTNSKPRLLDQCFLQEIRPSYSKCQIQNCTYISPKNYNLNISQNLLAQPKITKQKLPKNNCIKVLTKYDITEYVLVGVIILSILFLILKIFKCKKYQCRCLRSENESLISTMNNLKQNSTQLIQSEISGAPVKIQQGQISINIQNNQ